MKERGLTIIEVLVAVIIVATIAALAYAGATGKLDNRDTTEFQRCIGTNGVYWDRGNGTTFVVPNDPYCQEAPR